jgi:hypothetical protein
MNVWGKIKKISFGGMIAGAMIIGSSFSVTGCLTDDDKDDSTATTKTPLSTESTIDVGAQGASGGSVIDLDSAKAWSSAVANANQSGIDLVFMYYGGAFHLDNAVAAKAAGVANAINLTNTYSDAQIKDIKIVKITTKPDNQEAAKAAFDAGTAIKGSAVVEGDMFLVMSTGGKLALVTVGPIVGADKTGGAKIKLSVNTI